MLKILTIILAFLFVCHLCLAEDLDRTRQMREERTRPFEVEPTPRYRFQVSAPRPDEPRVLRKIRMLTVDAAFSLHSEGGLKVYLFIRNQVQVLRNNKFYEEKPRKDFHLPDEMNLQAAFVTRANEDKRVYYGDAYGKFVSVMDDVKEKRLKYGPARAFIKDGGPDAAGRRYGKVYVFKGCEVAVRNGWNDWGKPVNVTSLNLPCDVNAAWNEVNTMVILKGDNIWHWNDDDTVSGPQPFESKYKLKDGDVLKPARDEKPPQQTVTDYQQSVPAPQPERPEMYPGPRPSDRYQSPV